MQAVHVPLAQIPLLQSEGLAQLLALSQAGQAPPPQSTSVSLPPRVSSWQSPSTQRPSTQICGAQWSFTTHATQIPAPSQNPSPQRAPASLGMNSQLPRVHLGS